MSKEFVILNRGEVWRWVERHLNLGTPAVATLFGGDRLTCIDEGVGLSVDGEEVGVATIAPNGEMMSGEPTIVVLLVRHEFRRRGFGRELMMGTIDRCRERGLVPVRCDALVTYIIRIYESLPDEYKNLVRLNDVSMGGMLDPILLL